jgi:hypothetical protein
VEPPLDYGDNVLNVDPLEAIQLDPPPGIPRRPKAILQACVYPPVLARSSTFSTFMGLPLIPIVKHVERALWAC